MLFGLYVEIIWFLYSLISHSLFVKMSTQTLSLFFFFLLLMLTLLVNIHQKVVLVTLAWNILLWLARCLLMVP